MSKLTDLQVMQIMNQNDMANGTQTLGFCYDCIGGNTVKNGAEIKMGAPADELLKIMSGERIPLLVLIDKEEFKRIKQS